ncbi:type II toxin-antitoxin system RelE/ParE family toxin [Beggiatoa alba]|nr:type II toxin-antitoxin system RelE/ParE family toxin [bacterium AH-315-E07]MBN4081951.1 type II toxin-antitoxin system RelE/ParE family toxin [Beggiatoa alba]
MAGVIWTEVARLDLDEITDHIAHDSMHYAQAVSGKILKMAKRIPEHPKMGRMVPELADEVIRERFIYHYRLIYEIRGKQIIIITLIHGSRLLIGNIGDRFDSEND